jgi:hypothetical protein
MQPSTHNAEIQTYDGGSCISAALLLARCSARYVAAQRRPRCLTPPLPRGQSVAFPRDIHSLRQHEPHPLSPGDATRPGRIPCRRSSVQYVQHACVQRENAVLGRGGEERRCHPTAIGREKSPRDGRSCRARPSVGLRTPGTSAGWSSPYLVLYPTHVLRPSCLAHSLQSPLIQPREAASAERRDHISPTSSPDRPNLPKFSLVPAQHEMLFPGGLQKSDLPSHPNVRLPEDDRASRPSSLNDGGLAVRGDPRQRARIMRLPGSGRGRGRIRGGRVRRVGQVSDPHAG